MKRNIFSFALIFSIISVFYILALFIILKKREKIDSNDNKCKSDSLIVEDYVPPPCTNYVHVLPKMIVRIKTATIEEKHQYYVYDNGIYPELVHYHNCKFCRLKKLKEKYNIKD